jgi:hypothetical protein
MHPRQHLANAVAAAEAARAEVASLGTSRGFISRTDEERAADAELEAANKAFNVADCGVSAARAALTRVPDGPLHYAGRAAAQEALDRAEAAAHRAAMQPSGISIAAAQARVTAAQQHVAELQDRAQARFRALPAAQDRLREAETTLQSAVSAVMEAEIAPLTARWAALRAEMATLSATLHALHHPPPVEYVGPHSIRNPITIGSRSPKPSRLTPTRRHRARPISRRQHDEFRARPWECANHPATVPAERRLGAVSGARGQPLLAVAPPLTLFK